MKAMLKAKQFTMAVACLAFAALFASCPMDNQDDGQTGGIPAALVGSWGAGNVEFIRINADGTGTLDGNAATWSVDGNRLTLSLDLGPAHGGLVSGSAIWQIVGGRLRLSNGQGITGPLLEILPDLDRLGEGNGAGPGPGDGNGGGTGRIPAELVGEWGVAGTVFLTINANGTGAHHALQGNTIEWSVDGNRLIMTIDMGAGQGGFMTSSARWEIVGGRLRLTDGQGHMGPILMMSPYLDRIGGENGTDPDPGDGNGGDTGRIPAELVGEWGVAGTVVLTINADGTGAHHALQGNTVEWSVDGNRLIMTIDMGAGQGGFMTSSVRWEIVGGRLRLTDGQGHMGPILTMSPYLDRIGGENGGDNGGGQIGDMPTALVGSWGTGTNEMLQINTDGSGHVDGTPVSWSASAGRLTAVWSPGGPAFTGSVAWSIQGDRLHFSNPQEIHGTVLMALMSITIHLGSPGFERLGGIPAALVGSWGIGTDEMFQINSDGSGHITETPVSWSVNGDRLTAVWSPGGSAFTGSVAWNIQGGRLHFSSPQGTQGTALMTLMNVTILTGRPGFERIGDGDDCGCGCECDGGGCQDGCGNCSDCNWGCCGCACGSGWDCCGHCSSCWWEPDPCCGCGCGGRVCGWEWGYCGDCSNCRVPCSCGCGGSWWDGRCSGGCGTCGCGCEGSWCDGRCGRCGTCGYWMWCCGCGCGVRGCWDSCDNCSTCRDACDCGCGGSWWDGHCSGCGTCSCGCGGSWCGDNCGCANCGGCGCGCGDGGCWLGYCSDCSNCRDACDCGCGGSWWDGHCSGCANCGCCGCGGCGRGCWWGFCGTDTCSCGCERSSCGHHCGGSCGC